MAKKIMVAVALLMAVAQVYSQRNVRSEELDSMHRTVEAVDQANEALYVALSDMGYRLDVKYRDDGSVSSVFKRGGYYAGIKGSFDITYISKVYPAFDASITFGHSNMNCDVRFNIGVAMRQYGALTDTTGIYFAPKLSVEALGYVANWGAFEENHFLIGGELGFVCDKMYNTDNKTYMFSVTAGRPYAGVLLEYQRSFFESRSSLAVTAFCRIDSDFGMNTHKLGMSAGVSLAYRFNFKGYLFKENRDDR